MLRFGEIRWRHLPAYEWVDSVHGAIGARVRWASIAEFDHLLDRAEVLHHVLRHVAIAKSHHTLWIWRLVDRLWWRAILWLESISAHHNDLLITHRASLAWEDILHWRNGLLNWLLIHTFCVVILLICVGRWHLLGCQRLLLKFEFFLFFLCG